MRWYQWVYFSLVFQFDSCFALPCFAFARLCSVIFKTYRSSQRCVWRSTHSQWVLYASLAAQSPMSLSQSESRTPLPLTDWRGERRWAWLVSLMSSSKAGRGGWSAQRVLKVLTRAKTGKSVVIQTSAERADWGTDGRTAGNSICPTSVDMNKHWWCYLYCYLWIYFTNCLLDL